MIQLTWLVRKLKLNPSSFQRGWVFSAIPKILIVCGSIVLSVGFFCDAFAEMAAFPRNAQDSSNSKKIMSSDIPVGNYPQKNFLSTSQYSEITSTYEEKKATKKRMQNQEKIIMDKVRAKQKAQALRSLGRKDL